MPFQGNTLLFPLMALVGLAIIVYFLREARDGFHWFKTLRRPDHRSRARSPSPFYLMMQNRAGLTSGVYEGWVKAVPYYLARHLPRRLCAGPHLQVRSKERYEAVGKFIHEEALTARP